MKNRSGFKSLLRKNKYLLLLVTFLLIMTIIGQRVAVQAQEIDSQTLITSAVTNGTNPASFYDKGTNSGIPASGAQPLITTPSSTTTTTTTTHTTTTTTTTTPTTTTTTTAPPIAEELPTLRRAGSATELI